MNCEKCPADSALGCAVGVKPYQLRSGDSGCAWNMRTIKKHMNDRKPFTNYDRLIRKTPEEMADFISGKARTFGEEYEGYMSALDWLREEASE